MEVQEPMIDVVVTRPATGTRLVVRYNTGDYQEAKEQAEEEFPGWKVEPNKFVIYKFGKKDDYDNYDNKDFK